MKNNAGFSLIEVLIAAALIGVIVVGSSSLVKVGNQIKFQMDTVRRSGDFKRLAIEHINNSTSWSQTIANNPGMACMNTSGGCPLGVPATSFTLYDGQGNPVMREDPTQGFGLDGVSCNSFSLLGSTECPLRFQVQWRAVCTVPPCVKSQIEVTGELLYSPGTDKKAVVNTGRFGFQYVRGQTLNSLEESCMAMGGVYDNNTQKCRLPMAGKCAYGVVLGVDPGTKTKICGMPFNGSCGAGQVMTGVFADGTPKCCPIDCTGWVPPVGWTDGIARPPAPADTTCNSTIVGPGSAGGPAVGGPAAGPAIGGPGYGPAAGGPAAGPTGPIWFFSDGGDGGCDGGGGGAC